MIEYLKQCDHAGCDRRCRWDTHYCCTPCYLADTHGEPAAHDKNCDGRHAARRSAETS